MKRTLFLALYLFLAAFAARAFGVEAKSLVGNYELTGVMETAGLLMLQADGTYAAGFIYGAADWTEVGTWKLEGEEVVLSGGRFKIKNYPKLPLFLPSGTRLRYQDGKLTNLAPDRKFAFLDPNKTPSGSQGAAGEGRMRVRGKVVKLDAETLVVRMEQGDCLSFAVGGLSPVVRKAAQKKQGAAIDVEIPYSAILGGGSCP